MSDDTADPAEENDEMVFAATTEPYSNIHSQLARQQGAWLIDSGATRSMTPDRRLFTGEVLARRGKVSVAKQDELLDIEGEGTITVLVPDADGNTAQYRMSALYVPGLAHNLLATCDVVERGGSVVLSEQPYIEVDGIVIRCERYGRQTMLMPMERAYITEELLHRRMAHSDRARCTKLAKQLGVTVTERSSGTCETCTEANMRRCPLPKKSLATVTQLLEYVSCDMSGPFTRSIDGKAYIIVYVDHHSDYVFDYYLKSKDEAVQSIEWFIRDAGGVPKTFRADGAGELQKGEARARWTELHVQVDATTRATPEQNGRAERKLTVITEHVRALLIDARLPEQFWPFAAHTAAVTLNMFLTSALKREDTPFHRFHGRQPDLSRLRVFGCRAWVHDPRAKKTGKLKPRAQKAVFLGYRTGVKGWLFYLHDTGAIVCSRDARMLEDVPGGLDLEEIEEANEPRDEDYIVNEHDIGETESDANRRTERPRRTPQAPGAWWIGANAVWEIGTLPLLQPPASFSEAMSTDQREGWLAAIQEELENHTSLETFKWVRKQPGMQLLTGGWVFTVKTDQRGEQLRLKARLFVRGCTQAGGTYGVTSSPVAPVTMMRLMLAQAAKDKWVLAHVDFKAAYLNAPLQEIVYMKPVEGMNAPPGTVCQLLRAWPGLKQAGVCWWRVLKSWMCEHGFRQAQAERCLFVRPDIRATSYVDDMLVAAVHKYAQETLVSELQEKFRVTATPLKQYLNIAIVEKGGRVYASQKRYIEQLLVDCNMAEANGCATPAGTVRLEDVTGADCEQACDVREYRNLVGRLLWLSGCTRPDVTYAVNQLTKYYHEPRVKHMRAAKRVVRYLSRTRTLGIELSRGGDLVAYVDADWAGDTSSRRSVSGMLLGFARADGTLVPLAWRSVQQTCVATSSCFAEYAACHDVCRELAYVRQVCSEQGWISGEYVTPVWCDNSAAIAIGNDTTVKKLSRYIDIRYHYARWCAEQQLVRFQWIQGGKNPADVFTKPTSREIFKRHISRFMTDVGGDERE